MAENFFKNVRKYESKIYKLLDEEKKKYNEIKNYENTFIKNLLKSLNSKNKEVESKLRNAATLLRNKYKDIEKEAAKYNTGIDKNEAENEVENELDKKLSEYFSKTDNEGISDYLDIPINQYGLLSFFNIIPKLDKGSKYNYNDNKIMLEFNKEEKKIKIFVDNEELKEIYDKELSDITDYKKISNTIFNLTTGSNENKIFYDFLRLFILDSLRVEKKADFESKLESAKESLTNIIDVIIQKKQKLNELNKNLEDNYISGGKYNNSKEFIEDAIDNNKISISDITNDDKNLIEKEKIKQFLSDFIVDLKNIEQDKILKNNPDDTNVDIKDKEFESSLNLSLVGKVSIPLIDENDKKETVVFAEKYSKLNASGIKKGNSEENSYFEIYDELGVSDINAIKGKKKYAAADINQKQN